MIQLRFSFLFENILWPVSNILWPVSNILWPVSNILFATHYPQIFPLKSSTLPTNRTIDKTHYSFSWPEYIQYTILSQFQ